MKKQDLFKEIGLIDEKLIQEADTVIKVNFLKKTWVKVGSIAACFALILSIGIPIVYNQNNKIYLSQLSNNVSVKYVKDIPGQSTSGDLAELSEQELFSKYNTSVFKGEILKIDNVEMDFKGEKEYRAIAQIKIDKVYRGNCKVGEIVSVLLPCPINSGVWVEDTETVSAMRVGMAGIFMPTAYSEDSLYKTNDATLALKDIADYGFADGSRYAFLETEKGLAFSKWAYKSIKNATTIGEIEKYVESMIR